MALQSILIVELRWAFKTCARSSTIPRLIRRDFSIVRPLLGPKDRSAGGKPAKLRQQPQNKPLKTNLAIREAEKHWANLSASKASSQSSRELVPLHSKSTSVSNRKIDVPVKVIPKAKQSYGITLTPKEQLQIEYLTRQAPKRAPKKVYRERLLIYHGGLFRSNFLSVMKLSSLVVLILFLVIVVPAYYVYGAPWWKVLLLLLAGTVPCLLVNYTSRTFVNWIHLSLPHTARQSPKAALQYARNLPENAILHISFMRFQAIPATIDVNIAELVPTKSFWRPETFAWVGERVNRGSWYRSNPTKFYVRPTSGTGKEARDVIPGIWEPIYKRISGIESDQVAKWRM